MGRKKLLPSSSSCLLATDREEQCAMSYLPQRQMLKLLVVPEVWDEWELGPSTSRPLLYPFRENRLVQCSKAWRGQERRSQLSEGIKPSPHPSCDCPVPYTAVPWHQCWVVDGIYFAALQRDPHFPGALGTHPTCLLCVGHSCRALLAALNAHPV